MTTWTRTIGLTLAVVLVTGARGDEAKVSGDLKTLQGAWVNIPGSEFPSRWEFTGETMKSNVNDNEYITKVLLEPKANPHPTIDLTVTEGPEELKGKTSKGIYKIDGDRLTICVGHPGADTRPTEFKMVEGEFHLFELQREKK